MFVTKRDRPLRRDPRTSGKLRCSATIHCERRDEAVRVTRLEGSETKRDDPRVEVRDDMRLDEGPGYIRNAT